MRAVTERAPVFLKRVHADGKDEAIALHILAQQLADRPALQELRAIQAGLSSGPASQDQIVRAIEIAPSLKHYDARVLERWGERTARSWGSKETP